MMHSSIRWRRDVHHAVLSPWRSDVSPRPTRSMQCAHLQVFERTLRLPRRHPLPDVQTRLPLVVHSAWLLGCTSELWKGGRKVPTHAC